MLRVESSMNSTRTWVTPPREPVRPSTLTTLASLTCVLADSYKRGEGSTGERGDRAGAQGWCGRRRRLGVGTWSPLPPPWRRVRSLLLQLPFVLPPHRPCPALPAPPARVPSPASDFRPFLRLSAPFELARGRGGGRVVEKAVPYHFERAKVSGRGWLGSNSETEPLRLSSTFRVLNQPRACPILTKLGVLDQLCSRRRKLSFFVPARIFP